MKMFGEWIEVVSTDLSVRVFLRFDFRARRSSVETIDVDLLNLWSVEQLCRHLNRIWQSEANG